MTATQQGPPGGRTTGEVPAVAAPPAGPALPAPAQERVRGHLAGLSVGQVVCWEVAVAAVVAAAVRRDWTLVPAALLVLAVLPLTAVHRHGRWLYQTLGVWLRYTLRRRSAAAAPLPVTAPLPAGPAGALPGALPGAPPVAPAGAVDPRLATLRELCPELTVASVVLRADERIGVAFDGRAWVGVVAVQPADDVLPDPQQRDWLPLRELAEALVVDDIALSGVQVLVHTVPAPTGALPEQSSVATSYRLLNTLRTPSSRQVWVALRLDPGGRPEAIAARGGGAVGAQRAVRRCVARVLELLESAGLRGRALDEEALRSVLALTALVRPTPVAAQGRRTAETWTSWQGDGTVHVTWWIRSWPGRQIPMQLLSDLAATLPALACTVSLTLHQPQAGAVRFRGLVRVGAASPDAAELAAAALAQAAATADVGLHRLDGEHALGVAATLPLGGGEL